MNKTKKTSKMFGLIPKIAKKLGENSVDSACTWWLYQPKVPEAMKKTVVSKDASWMH